MEDVTSEIARGYLAQRAVVDRLESELKDAKAQSELLEEKTATQFAFRGVQQMKLETGEVLFLAAEVHCSKKGEVPTEDLISSLRESNLGMFVSETYAVGRLKAYAKEKWDDLNGKLKATSAPTQDQWDAALPEPLRGKLRIYNRTRVRVHGLKDGDFPKGELNA